MSQQAAGVVEQGPLLVDRDGIEVSNEVLGPHGGGDEQRRIRVALGADCGMGSGESPARTQASDRYLRRSSVSEACSPLSARDVG